MEYENKIINQSQFCCINHQGRFECAGSEFEDGDVIEVLMDGIWHTTIVRYNEQSNEYRAIDNVGLLGKCVKKIFSTKLAEPRW